MRRTRNNRKCRNRTVKRHRKIIGGGEELKTSVDAIREILPEKGKGVDLTGKRLYYEAKAIKWQTENKIPDKLFFGVDYTGKIITSIHKWRQNNMRNKERTKGILTNVMGDFLNRVYYPKMR